MFGKLKGQQRCEARECTRFDGSDIVRTKISLWEKGVIVGFGRESTRMFAGWNIFQRDGAGECIRRDRGDAVGIQVTASPLVRLDGECAYALDENMSIECIPAT